MQHLVGGSRNRIRCSIGGLGSERVVHRKGVAERSALRKRSDADVIHVAALSPAPSIPGEEDFRRALGQYPVSLEAAVSDARLRTESIVPAVFVGDGFRRNTGEFVITCVVVPGPFDDACHRVVGSFNDVNRRIV